MASFDQAPDELIVQILYLIPSTDLIASVQRLSRRFYHLCQEPKLWLARCRSDFGHWAGPSRARLARAGRANRGPWKQMWLDRRRGDASTARHFEHVLASKVNRVRHLEAICRRGLNAKDFLLQQYHLADDAADDVLARRYYANTALASIHRGLAIEEWCKVLCESNGFHRLDRALGAFDMFVLHDADEDMDRIEELLDQLADEFRRDHRHPSVDSMTVREKAHALVRWIRMRNLAGMADPSLNYRNMRNCLIGQALTDPEHPSLPIISSAIFASIGERIGLRAFCCAVPGHVHATVLGNPGESVDGTPLASDPQQPQRPGPPTVSRVTLRERTLVEDGMDEDGMGGDGPGQGEREGYNGSSSSSTPSYAVSPIAIAAAATHQVPTMTYQMLQLWPMAPNDPRPFTEVVRNPASLPDNGERMFLDPYNNDQEMSLGTLRQSIAEVDWGIVENRDLHLLPMPTSAIVLRVALNMEASWSHANQVSNVPQLSTDARRLRRGDPDMNLEALLYATIWATALMRPLDSPGWDRYLDSLLARFAHFYSEDVWIIAKFLLPLYDRYVDLSGGIGNVGGLLSRLAAGRFGDDNHNNGGNADDNLPPPRHQNGPPPAVNNHANGQQEQQQQRLRGWTDPRVMIKMVYNLDQRQPLVSRRYTQDICEKVLFRIGQVFRHRRFGYIGIINGWSPDDPTSLPSPNNMSMAETTTPSDAEDSGGSGRGTPVPFPNGGGPLADTAAATAAAPRRRKKSAFYTCLRTGVERQVVAQRNIEIVTDPDLVPEALMFLAGKHFKRFDRSTCTFVSNLREFYPDD
ncbi:hypothetical protein HMPREF1624_00946 [Sporothrix schenckii ATCC 58251]|uniref:F-box domain-containing protein n=1 Tax=Sporothrix schenckii (strain ATCC 58251 / de Perez 2211183) TaxID=1391915 RepID=U7Q6I9_SPOS1|nr:hypothetical protein HMPREF1624_00946 [Sporothrix schenckii ATCC 58251]